ncbi:MAG: DegV family protein [Candidatus Izemoplasmatales bacterium]
MSNRIKLVSDSTCDLSQDLIQKYDIDIVPLYVNFEEESFFDGVNLTTPEMYKMVKERGILPKTAAASPGSFYETFLKYTTQGIDVIYIGLGSKFSATYQAAHTAKSMIEEGNVFLIDSQNLSSGSGLLLLKAAKFREEGMNGEQITHAIEQIVGKVRSQFVIDTLEYLYKGGRLNALSTVMGTMLRIKPIIKVRDGVMAVGKKGRGSLKNGIDLMLQEVLTQEEDIDLDFCMITHSMSDDYTDYIKSSVKEIPFKNVFVTNAGCVISSHCGKGTIGILYILK